ncbi:MAG: hypothetical protein ACLFOY_19350 [Desulfatibacillaceae bacterium]
MSKLARRVDKLERDAMGDRRAFFGWIESGETSEQAEARTRAEQGARDHDNVVLFHWVGEGCPAVA